MLSPFKEAVLWRFFQVFVEHLLEWYSNIIVHLVVCKNFPLNYRQSMRLMISTSCSCVNYCLLELLVLAYWNQGPIPERLISINPGLKFCSVFVFYIPMYCLWQHFVFSGSIILKGSTVFCNLQLHVLPGLKLTNFRGTGPTFLIKGTKGRITGLRRLAQRKRQTSVLGGGGEAF